MLSSKQELLLIQYADAKISARSRAQAERLLRESDEARQTLSKYRQLDWLLRRTARPPKLNWDALSSLISSGLGGNRKRIRRSR
jgi:triphosphoribosyl-dephospho-CoA synthetase